MKIAIFTLRGEFNYGNLLQSFALQKVLRDFGAEVEFLNRRKNYPSVKLFCTRIVSIFKCIFRRYLLRNKDIVVNSPFAEDYLIYKKDRIDNAYLIAFTKRYLNVSKRLCSTNEMAKYAKKSNFDCYVVGSDQVWREFYVPNIEDYFLGFLPKDFHGKRIAYAASFGTYDHPISDENLGKCIQLAKTFDAISVREQGAVKYMEEAFHINATHVLDPTLLLKKEVYETLIEDKDSNNTFGLVSYILDETDEKDSIISYCASTLNLSRSAFFSKEKNDQGIVKYKSVSEWLSCFKNAQFVVTDSFHGCVFSIIFQKDFIVIGNAERGMDRFTSLLNLLGLQDRLVLSYKDFVLRKEMLLRGINYNEVKISLERCKKNSLDFLSRALF